MNLLLFSLGYLAGTSAEERATNALSGKVRFFLLGGGGTLQERVISKIFTNLRGPNLFCSPLEQGHTFIRGIKYSTLLLLK